jgi:NADH-quinone oxidoreductase subunit L
MIMGLAAGSYFSGMFHLTTHAGFKALLFLCAGVFIHAFETNDMFEIGRRGGRRMKVPMICMLIGAAALAGLPPFSGFFSKELIMAALAGLKNPIWLVAGLMGVFLTAYYTFRLIFVILRPPARDESGADAHHDHGHGGYWLMGWPLIFLAAVTVILGFFEGALEEFFKSQQFIRITGDGHHAWLPFAALGSAAAGVILAWIEYGRRGAAQIGFVEKIKPLNNLFAERWYIDHFYRRFLDVFIYGVVSRGFTNNDNKVIDGGIDGLSRGTVSGGRFSSILHQGMIQYRLLTIFVVIVLLALYFFF